MFIDTGKTRKRSVSGPSFLLREMKRSPNGFWIDATQTLLFDWIENSRYEFGTDGTQVTESDGNRWPLPKGSGLTDYGSEFFTQKTEMLTTRLPFSVRMPPKGATSVLYKAEGPVVANFCDVLPPTSTSAGAPVTPLRFSFPPDLSSSRKDLEVKGTEAIAACSPANSIAQTASAVGELLQDVPAIPGIALWRSRLGAILALGAAADEFLNVEFGILPTLADMTDFLKAVHKIDKAVDQFVRDAGRVVRRQFAFPTIVDVSDEVLYDRVSPLGMDYDPLHNFGVGRLANNVEDAYPCYYTNRRRVTERKVWFSGAFTYFLPGGYDTHSASDRRMLMAKLFGAKPDLNTLWQLAPWSWAVDWFVDAGSFVKNLESYLDYGTILRYGYVMEQTTTTDTYSVGPMIVPGRSTTAVTESPSIPHVSSVSLRRTTKKRIRANPFGFGISWDGLSPIQEAITAALGITRVVR